MPKSYLLPRTRITRSLFSYFSLSRFLSLIVLVAILFLLTPQVYSAQVTLAWDPNTEPDLDGYMVYYKEVSSGPPYNGTGATEGDSPIDVGNVTEFTLHGLTDGVTYFFAVTAYDTEDLESSYSNEVSTTGTGTVSVTSITSSTDNGCYKTADTVNITISFSEAVTLAGGNLIATLDTGRAIEIDSISSQISVGVTYTVQAGDESSDLNVESFELSEGATLQNNENLDCDLSLPTGSNLADNNDIVIDAVAPASSATAPDYGNAALSITWAASDATSGVASTELWYKKGSGGTWSNTGLAAQTGTSGTFSYTPPDGDGTYYFATRSTDDAGNREAEPSGNGDDSTVYDTIPPTAPTVSGTTPTNDTTPTWNWSSGAGGNGTYRYKLNNSNLSSGATQTTTTSYTPGSALSEGSHTLYVQEQDAVGNWSSSGSHTIVIDITAPTAPTVSGTTPTNDTTPTWNWSSGAGGNGTYRYKLDNSNLSSGATQTTSTSYTPGSALSEGPHTLYVQERDAVGNWSSSGSFTIVIDITAPTAPTVSGTTPTNDTTPTWSWSSGGGGNGTYRYKLDNSNLSSGATQTTTTSYTPGSDLSEGSHSLYVQERDAVGNWSSSGSHTIVIDITAPTAPAVSGSTPTNDTTPTWNWSSGAGGNGTYRYKLDNSNLSSGATQTTTTSYTPGSDLSEGSHSLYVQERDAVGNWSSSGSHTIVIDITAPGTPVITTDGGNGPGTDYTSTDSSITLNGTCAADTVAIYVNGSTNGVTYTPGETSWSYTGTLDSGENILTITAEDTAGNVTDAGSITVTYSATSGQPVGGYSDENVIPAARINQSTIGDGIITIHFKIKDTTSDPCTLHTFEYSVNGGDTWNVPDGGDSSQCLSSGWQDNDGDHYSSAADFDGAEEHSFTFSTKHGDVTGLDGEDQSDVRVRFTINDSSYDSLSPVTSENFRVDNLEPIVSITYSDDNPSHVDVGTLIITGTFNEPLSATPWITIDRPNPMSTIGPVDMSGSGSIRTYDLTVEQHNGSTVVDGVNLVTISNVSDLFGNDVQESSNFTTHTRDTDSDGQRDYVDTDDDNDELPDTWEEAYGLDPLDSGGVNGSDGDFDNDSWTNYEEYVAGTDPADETSFPAASAPEIVETIPHHNAGINGDTVRIPNDTSFCVRIEDSDGIDITDLESITFTINDAVNETYTRDLGDETVVRVVKLTEDEDAQVTKLWAVYDRSKDDEYGNNYAFDSTITVGVDVKERTGIPIDPVPSYTFKIESETQHHEAHDPGNLPDTGEVASDDPDLEDPQYVYDAGIKVKSGDLEGAKIIYNSNEPVTPRLGPTDEIPSLAGGRSAPMNLQPPTVFNTPVKILIPYPRYDDVSHLHIYLYKGASWVRACDNKGRMRPGGDGWMIPGSRVDHNNGSPSTIEIKIYHLSAVQAKPDTVSSSPLPDTTPSISVKATEAGGGGGCFIATAAFASNMDRGVDASPRAAVRYDLVSITAKLIAFILPWHFRHALLNRVPFGKFNRASERINLPPEADRRLSSE